VTATHTDIFNGQASLLAKTVSDIANRRTASAQSKEKDSHSVSFSAVLKEKLSKPSRAVKEDADAPSSQRKDASKESNLSRTSDSTLTKSGANNRNEDDVAQAKREQSEFLATAIEKSFEDEPSNELSISEAGNTSDSANNAEPTNEVITAKLNDGVAGFNTGNLSLSMKVGMPSPAMVAAVTSEGNNPTINSDSNILAIDSATRDSALRSVTPATLDQLQTAANSQQKTNADVAAASTSLADASNWRGQSPFKTDTGPGSTIDSDLIQKSNSATISHSEYLKSALMQDFSQQKHAQANTHHLVRDNLNYSSALGERSAAENFLNAMQSAIRAQIPVSDKAGQAGTSLAAMELMKSASLSNESLSSDATTSALSGIKSESTIEASNPALRLFAPMSERVGQGQWHQDFSQRINMMLNHQIQHAQIQLHPKHLGAMEISVSLGQDHQVSINFQVNHAHVKDALDAALPRLREMLQNQGFDLQHSDISYRQQDSGAQSSHSNSAHSSFMPMSPDSESEIADPDTSHHISILSPSNGGLDLFV